MPVAAAVAVVVAGVADVAAAAVVVAFAEAAAMLATPVSEVENVQQEPEVIAGVCALRWVADTAPTRTRRVIVLYSKAPHWLVSDEGPAVRQYRFE